MGFTNLLELKNTKPGIGENVWFAPVAWFTPNGIKKAIPDSVIIAEDHEFLPGKGFVKLQLAPRKNKLDVTSIGDLGLNKFFFELDIFLPGSYAELHEQVQNLLNVPLIVLCYDADCPIEFYYDLGTAEEASYLTVDFTTGVIQDGSKGYAGRIYTTSTAVWLYEGFITTPDEQPILTEQGDFILTESGEKIYIE